MLDVFHSGMKYLYEKYCPSYAAILPSSKGLKNALVFRKATPTFYPIPVFT